MNFKHLDNEHVAQDRERMKSLVKKCPTHGLTTWMVIQTFYAGLNFTLRNLLRLGRGRNLYVNYTWCCHKTIG